jgi:hypothetical protein
MLDIKAFRLKDCDIRELAGALGGKAVLLRQFTSSASADVRLPPGSYELVVQAWARHDEGDAFNVFVNGRQSRLYPDRMRALAPTPPVPFTVTGDDAVNLRIAASEENGMLVDRVLIRPVSD